MQGAWPPVQGSGEGAMQTWDFSPLAFDPALVHGASEVSSLAHENHIALDYDFST